MRPSFDLAYEARRATLAELLTSQSVPLTMTPGLTCMYRDFVFQVLSTLQYHAGSMCRLTSLAELFINAVAEQHSA